MMVSNARQSLLRQKSGMGQFMERARPALWAGWSRR